MSEAVKVDGFIVLYSRVRWSCYWFFFSMRGLLYILIGKPAQYTNPLRSTSIMTTFVARTGGSKNIFMLWATRKIAYLGVDNSLVFSADRKTGYMTALISHGLTITARILYRGSGSFPGWVSGASKLLLSENRPTAVLVSDDILALSLERICMEADISIPEGSVHSFL